MNDENKKITVIHHSADFDGIFCREIARKFLPDAELIGWDFGDAPLDIEKVRGIDGDNTVYILDLPVDKPFGADPKFIFSKPGWTDDIIWIDHHKSAIESHPGDIQGYRIDGVAACRLTWQWFYLHVERRTPLNCLPLKHEFVDRELIEPLAVRLAGEYDIWDKRDPRAELFQHGLRSMKLWGADWEILLSDHGDAQVDMLLERGKVVQYVRDQEYAEVITRQGFDVEFEGLRFLACNSHELDIRSHLFEAGIRPHHDGLLGFTFNGKDWRVSLYGVPGKPDVDFAKIAVKHGGGGHKQACGFRATKLPWLP